MSRFNKIDYKLERLTKRLNAKLTKDRVNYPEQLRTFEERRIDWMDLKVNKAIIIQPIFEDTGVNCEIWNVINLAWTNDLPSMPKWVKILIHEQKFEIIEQEIDSILINSEMNLSNIKMVDLK